MMTNLPLVSVIIPVYNVGRYLPECVDSVLCQTYTNLEIILVDDGSPDNCPELCDKYAGKDSRVKVIHKQNGGLSDARNAGLDIAAGEYITFIDSDDWAAPDMIEFLCTNMQKDDADISCCGHYRSYKGLTDFLPEGNGSPRHRVLTNEEAAIMTNASGFALSAWGKLYKKHIFSDIRYPVGKLYEDQWVIIDVFMAARRISLDSTPKYYYRKRKSSIVRNDDTAINLLKIEMLEERQSNIEQKYPNLIPVGEAALYKRYLQTISALLSDGDIKENSGKHEILTSLLHKVKANAPRLYKNKHLSLEIRLNLLLLAKNTRFHKPYNKLQALIHPVRTYRRKKKRKIKQTGRVLFD